MTINYSQLPGHYARMLDLTHSIRAPIMQAVIASLDLPVNSHGLDAGCGIGLLSVMLAEALGPRTTITGIDLSPDFIDYAREMGAARGLSERISFRTGDVNDLPFENNTFDWTWSVDCIGYAPFNPIPALKELIRVSSPGGKLAILAWSSEQFLPGYPRLEANLKATTAGIAPFEAENPPESHFLRSLGWFRELGLTDLAAQTFCGTVHAPLTGEIREALEALIGMRWPGADLELSSQDSETYQRICSPDSPAYILDHPDYMAFFTYTLFTGMVP